MNKLNKKIVSLVVTVMMLASAFLIPGVFNFSRVSAETGFRTVDVKLNIGGDNVLIAGHPSNDWVKNVNSNSLVATVTSPDGNIVITITDWDIRGNNSSVLDIMISANNVELRNISAAVASQSQGGGGETIDNIPLTIDEKINVSVGNNLNFIEFTMDVYDVFDLSYVTNMEGLSYPNQSFLVGDSVSPPTPTQEGFTFDGWFINSDFSALFESFSSMPPRDVIVYGRWTADDDDDDDDSDDDDSDDDNDDNDHDSDDDDDDDSDDDDDDDSDDDNDDDDSDDDNDDNDDDDDDSDDDNDDNDDDSDDGEVEGDQDEFVDEEQEETDQDEETTNDELDDDGDVLGDSDEFVEEVEEEVEEEERTSEEVDDDDKGEVLGDSDQLPEMSDTNYAIIALFFLIIGLLTLVATKPEEEVI